MCFLKQLLLCSTLSGGGGGLAWFLLGLRYERIRNNKFVRKGVLEVAGGMLVASFLGYPFSRLFSGVYLIVIVSFSIGVGWSGILQILRRWITGRVTVFLNEGKD